MPLGDPGADVIKVPFTGDAESYHDIVATTPVWARYLLRAPPACSNQAG